MCPTEDPFFQGNTTIPGMQSWQVSDQKPGGKTRDIPIILIGYIGIFRKVAIIIPT